MFLKVKSININYKTMLTIPKKWRNEFNMDIGHMVNIQIENNQIIIQKNAHDSNSLMSIVGRDGTIHIPKEVRNYFQYKGVKEFVIYADHNFKKVILAPDNGLVR